MNKILSILKQSNRYKHLVGGFIVGLPALTRTRPYTQPPSQPPRWSSKTSSGAVVGTGRTGHSP